MQNGYLGKSTFLSLLKKSKKVKCWQESVALPDVVSGSSALFADDTLVYDQCHGGPVTTCCRLQRDM